LALGAISCSKASDNTAAPTGSIPLTCSGLAGGRVSAADGKYLGRLTNRFDDESILSTFGDHGSRFGSASMYNQVSSYGNLASSLSAYNTVASTPPKLNVAGQFAAYVTKNTAKSPRVDPDTLRSCSFP
jgi:hypothetical protein